MAAELIGGALLSAFLQVAFDRLASPDVLHFFRKRKLNETLLDKLKIMLLSINTVVDDAEQKQISNPNVKAWLDSVKDAVYDAEDVLDEIDYEATKRKVEAESQTTATSSKVRLRSFFSASVSSFEKEIETRMKNVLENLEYLASQKDILKLEEGRGGAVMRSPVSERLPTTSLVDEAEIYGRDNDKERIMKWLLSNNDTNQLSIISVVGMGGLGKTTLAQHIYNDERMQGEFDLKAWVCVSDDFDVLRVTRTILEAITKSKDDSNDLNMLQIKLKQLLTEKRFLLILDDVWNENYMHWDALQKPFNHGAAGSKILVTTRSGKVASTMRSAKIHLLKHLSQEDSWSLFKRHAFHNADTPHSNHDFEDIGRKIIEKCKGLPLALKAIGSLLYTKLSFEEWNGVLNSEIWEEKSNILPALRLSYHYLPSLLKRCFAYCSLFPKDYDFDKEHLIRLWMAENFLQCTHQSKDARKVGEEFFNDLLSRSFFQRSSGDKMRFVMHDLVNDLAKYEAGKFCYRLEIDEANNLTKLTHHVSYLRNSRETSKRFTVIYQANRLRTFLPLSMQGYRLTSDMKYARWMSSNLIRDLLSKFKCLRVLSLSDYCEIAELPESIGNLKHLRFLDLSGTDVKKLPDKICELFHLQTLKLWRCSYLKTLPMDLHKLINLRHLDFRRTKVREMPKQLEKLKNLQVLSPFIVGKCKETNITQLKELNLRGTVSILELQNVVNPVDALGVNLTSKIHIEELNLGWSMDNDKPQNDMHVLEKLQPHKNLKKLRLSNYGGTGFPYWFADPLLSNIVSLELNNCNYCLSLPSFGLLPLLEFLRFEGMKGWEEWKCENVLGAFPRLKEFSIVHCPKLKEHLPTQLPSLRKLVIENCEQLQGSVPKAPSLCQLILKDCGQVQFECLPSTLKVLHIGGQLPDIFSVEKIENTIANTRLQELTILDCAHLELPLRYSHNFLLLKMTIKRSCDSLKSFPLDLFPKLQYLHLSECSNLEMISVSEGHHHSLTNLLIWDCPKFVSFPEGGFLAPKLEHCEINELESLKSLPERMHILFPSLRDLTIIRCPQVESFPEGGLPSNLSSIYISHCPKLTASRMEWNLHRCTSLEYLRIEDANVESLPGEGLLPPSLTSLFFHHCSNLRFLEHKGLCHLSDLRFLVLNDCPKLQDLPKEGLPRSLSTLKIVGCPLLKKKFQKQKGKDWEKISHIPCIQIDNDIVT